MRDLVDYLVRPDATLREVIEFVDRDPEAKGQDSGPVEVDDEGEAVAAAATA